MFFQLLFIHIYRPFLKYNRTTSPLPPHVSPRKYCTQAAAAVSKLLRLYKRTYGFSQICNIAVYIAHSACTIHLLNLPDKNAKRDIVHGVKHLEEIGEMWICARRTLRILNIMTEKWEAELPDEAAAVFSRTRSRWGSAEPELSPSLSDQAPSVSSRPAEVDRSPPVIDQQVYIKRSSSASAPFTQDDKYCGPLVPTKSHVGHNPISPTDQMMSPTEGSGSGRHQSRIAPIPELTEAQRDAWNTHQSRLQASGNQSMVSSSSEARASDPVVLFGGVESLVEESQNWWFKDQSALAVGINNWVGPESAINRGGDPTGDWSMGFSIPPTRSRGNDHAFNYGVNDFTG